MDYLNYTKKLFNVYNKDYSYINLENEIDSVPENKIIDLHPTSVKEFFPKIDKIFNVTFEPVKDINPLSIIHEYEFTIKLLTKYPATNLFFRDLDNVKIVSCIYKNYKRYKFEYKNINHLELKIIVNRNECFITVKHNLVEIQFKNIWPKENVNTILDLFKIYEIIAATKTNIKFYYVNNIKIPTHEIYIIHDIFFTSSLAKNIYINEINLSKTDKFIHRLYIYNIKFYLIEHVTNFLSFNNKNSLRFSTDLIFLKNVLDTLMFEFDKERETIIEIYKDLVKIKQKKNLKTKQTLFKLVEIEPSLFGKSSKFSQHCQKKRQPSIATDKLGVIIWLTDTLKKFYKDDNIYPYEEDNEIIKKFFLTRQINNLDEIIHVKDIRGISRMFVCLRDDLSKIFPGYIGDTDIICCFDKKCVKNANKALIHVLKEDKILDEKRFGLLPHFISDIIGNEYKRYGYKDLVSILYELYLLNPSAIYVKKEKIKDNDIELIDLILKRKNNKGNVIGLNSYKLDFYIPNERIIKLMKNKLNILDMYALEFKDKFNILSFIFKINIIIYKHSSRLGVPMFDLIQISSIFYKKYVFIYLNENGIYESIIKNKSIVHENGNLIDYVKFYYNKHDDILLI